MFSRLGYQGRRLTVISTQCIWPDQQRPPNTHRVDIDQRRIAVDIPRTDAALHRDTTPYHDLKLSRADPFLHRDEAGGFDAHAGDHASTSSNSAYGPPLHEFESPSPVLQDSYVASQYSAPPYATENRRSTSVDPLHRLSMQVRVFNNAFTRLTSV